MPNLTYLHWGNTMHHHYHLVECRPRILKVVQGCGFRPGHRLPHTSMLPVHHVYHEPVHHHAHVLPAYPEMIHQDVITHHDLPGHGFHHTHEYHSSQGTVMGQDCGCHPHAQHAHHNHGCGCIKEF